jgi:hypothetical protein
LKQSPFSLNERGAKIHLKIYRISTGKQGFRRQNGVQNRLALYKNCTAKRQLFCYRRRSFLGVQTEKESPRKTAAYPEDSPRGDTLPVKRISRIQRSL